MASQWRVDSHHVNVGNGDCSIHVLVYLPSNVAFRCVLLDGGSAWMSIDPGTGANNQNPIRNMLAYLDTAYRWLGLRCQFDTIVLSHWDEDHYGNLLKTIKEDASPRSTIPYLKYDSNNAPATFFYAPNWLAGYRLNGAFWAYIRERNGFAEINMDYVPRGQTQNFTWVPFGILRNPESALNNVLGAEFFNNTLCTQPLNQIDNLRALVNANKPQMPPPATTYMPCMYCIGVFQTTLGRPPAEVILEDPTRTNRVSIVCILYWADTGRISHYLAGDADQVTEGNVLRWIVDGGQWGRMTSVKLSHHGSRSSTPITPSLLGVARPRTVVLSIPSGMHVHPSLEIVYHVWLWAIASNSNPAILGTKYPHYTAVLPVANGGGFNRWNYTKAHRISVASLEDWNNSKYKPYWDDCTDLVRIINAALPAQAPRWETLVYQYWQLKQQYNAQPDDLRPFALNQLERMWQAVCHPLPASHPSVGQGYVLPQASAITNNNQIEAVVVRCSNDDSDGGVLHKYRGLPFLFPYVHSTKRSIYPTQQANTNANAAVPVQYAFPPNFAPDPRPAKELGPRGLLASGSPADIQNFYLNSGVVVTGRDADPPGTDPNEDEPDDQVVGNNTPPPPLTPRPIPPRAMAEEDDGYYLYSSLVSPQSITVAASQYTILSAGPLDTFLSTLHCSNLCLDGPSPPSPTGTTQLLASDEFGIYLTAALQAQGISVINAPQPYVGGFTFAAAPISGSGLDKAVLSFATTAVEDAFGLEKGTGPPLGIMEQAKALVFGLDTSVWAASGTNHASATLAQLVQFADITYLEQSPAVIFLSAIELQITDPATGHRNAVWFEPLSGYRATTRLQMDLSSDAVTQLNKYISAFPGLAIQSAFVIARRTCISDPAPAAQGDPASASSSITYGGSLTFGGDFVLSNTHFDAAVELQSTQTKLMLILRDRVDILDDIFSVLQPVLGLQGSHFEFQDWLKNTAGSTSFELPYLRRIVVVMDNDPGSKGGTSTTPGLASVQIDLETRVNFSGGAFAVFLITYTWTREGGGTSSNTLTAGLWTLPSGSSTAALELLPDYEAYYSLMPPVTLNKGEELPPSLDLRKLGGFDHLPSEIDPEVTRAELTIGSGGISFNGDVVAGPPNGAVPKVSLSQLTLNVSYLFKGGFTGSLIVMAEIQAAPGAKNGAPAQITGEVYYDGTMWKLGAVVSGIYGSTLYQFFDSDTQGGVGQVLDNLEIRSLAIEYDYQPGGGASSFAINGNIAIGTLTLSLLFTYSSTWEFKAFLDISEAWPQGTTLGDVLGQIFGTEVENDLPGFILNIPINPPQNKDAVGFDMVSVAGPPGSTDSGLFFTAWLQFEKMSFQALQYQPPTPVGGGARPPARRVFTMVVNSVPTANVDLVGDLAQPFDEMLLMYVQPQVGDNASSGITYGDVTVINAELAKAGRVQLPYQITKKTYVNSDVVLPIGAHFILVLKDSTGQPHVALDYVFYTPSVPVTTRVPGARITLKKDETPALVRTRRPIPEQVPVSSGSPGTAKAPYSKRIGPLTISNMGFKYTSDPVPTVSIIMDASVVLGPIGLALLGFSLGLKFPEGSTLYQIPIPDVSLAGLAVSFDKPPVILAGLLEHVVVDKPGPPPVHEDYYQGGITLSFQPWLFQADGFYGTITTATGSFKSAFVYFILGGPLVTIEVAEITGVTGGFGYNSNLQFPTVTNVVQFPFLKTATSTDPSTALTGLINSGWFSPQDGSFWLAAGFSVIAFELLQASVVAVIQWNPDIYLGLFGVATADMPPGTGVAKLLHVELGIVATVDFRHGVLKIEGQLAPSSFVLDPACHLTGGFALYQWFGGGTSATDLAPSDGDFVFTVGGYHRGFNPPAQYPVPPRLAISWSLDSSLSIKGESYFAITPNVCMAGGRLDASLSLGPLSAWFDAYADMLINYKPFFFSADGGISVGVGFTLDLWICTIHISCEISANLHIQGPSLSGTVYVNFWVFGFSIDFGKQVDGSDQALLLEDFYKLALQSDLPQQTPSPSSFLLPSTPGKASSDPPLPPPHIYTCNEGLIPSGDAASTPSSPDAPWNVRGAVFQFTVGCKFAIDTAAVITAQSDPNDPPIPPFNVPLTGSPVYAKPMHLTTTLSSTLTVTITPPAGTSPKQPRWVTCVGVVKAVPKALWGPYSSTNDPLSPSNPNPDPNRDPTLLNPTNNANPSPDAPGATLTALTMGLTLSSPPPQLSVDFIPPFDYQTYFIKDAGEGQTFHFPEETQRGEDGAWQPRGLPGDEGEEWEMVRTQWVGTPGLGQGAAAQAVAVWSGLSFAQWAVGDPAVVDGGMTGEAPSEILLGEEVFDGDFLEAPRLAAVAA